MSAGGEAASVEEATTVEMIASPGDLTSLGMAISDVLERLHGEVDSLSVCIDSVTVLLQYADQQRVFRFLHTINRRFELVGAAVHIHLDPVTQNDRVVATFATLAKSVVRYENGEWTRAR